MLPTQTRAETGSVIITFGGRVVETQGGLSRIDIERIVAVVGAMVPAPPAPLRLVASND